MDGASPSGGLRSCTHVWVGHPPAFAGMRRSEGLAHCRWDCLLGRVHSHPSPTGRCRIPCPITQDTVVWQPPGPHFGFPTRRPKVSPPWNATAFQISLKLGGPKAPQPLVHNKHCAQTTMGSSTKVLVLWVGGVAGPIPTQIAIQIMGIFVLVNINLSLCGINGRTGQALFSSGHHCMRQFCNAAGFATGQIFL